MVNWLMKTKKLNFNIGIIGIGYVGLPLAVEFGKIYKTIAFDTNKQRVNRLNIGYDDTLEISKSDLKNSKKLFFSDDINKLKNCNIYIITVPTPIFRNKIPDLRNLKYASQLVGKLLDDQDIVIYESTVFPGATEEVCVPILESNSSLNYINQSNQKFTTRGFYVGYSPERINTGDSNHNLKNIKKLVSGSTTKSAKLINLLYLSIIKAGTYLTKDIKTAEAAKVIENTQRDINIALVNELAIIFKKLNIDTSEVIEAASTKWNFMPFSPGLVGGHCIGVDPYYLTYQSAKKGYIPKVILSGRRINDSMGFFITQRIKKLLKQKKIKSKKINVLILGFTFKENCPDVRNTRVVDIVSSLKKFSNIIHIVDPWVDSANIKIDKKCRFLNIPRKRFYDVVISAVAHKQFKSMSNEKILSYVKKKSVIYDIKKILPNKIVDERL